jgi:L-threonylcarbamoyladenylate synthase
LRPGGVSVSRLAAMVGAIDEGPEILDEGPRASPGMLSKHYAPQGQTSLVDAETIKTALATLPADARVGVLTRTRLRTSCDDARISTWLALGDDPAAFARDLYDGLHRMDDTRCTHVLLERVPSTPEWRAVLDRLTRAAG